MSEIDGEMTLEEAEDLLEELEEQGRDALRMKLLNVKRFQTEAMVRAVIGEAVESRRRNPRRCLFLAGLAVDLSEKLPGESAVALQARALAEKANALRIGERLKEAAVVMLQAEGRLPEGEDRDRAELYFLRGALRKDLGQFEAAAHDARASADLYALVGDSRQECYPLVLLGQVLPGLHRFEEAQTALAKAIRQLKSDLWDPRLLVAAYANSIHNLTELAGTMENLERRESLLGQAFLSIANARPFIRDYGSEDDLLQLDWLSGRSLFLDGKLAPAERLYCDLFTRLLEKGSQLRAAVLGLDLCRVLLWEGNLDLMRKIAALCAEAFAGAELTEDLRKALRFLETVETAAQAEAVIVQTMQKCGAPYSGAPRGISL